MGEEGATPAQPEKNKATLSPWLRFFLGLFGATMVASPAIVNRFFVTLDNTAAGLGLLITLVVSWVASITITTLSESDNPFECILKAIGLPGLFLALVIGIKTIN